MFIVFEGIDGCGKSTQTKLLMDHLRRHSIPSVQAKDPGSTELGETLREIIQTGKGGDPVPRSELFIFGAARAQMVEKVIAPALSRGETVVCDRYSASTLAYQPATDVDLDDVHSIVTVAEGGYAPDLYLLLDIAPNIAAERLAQQQPTRFEGKGLEFLSKVRRNYLDQAQKSPSKWIVLSASMSPSELHSAIVVALTPVLFNGAAQAEHGVSCR